MRKLDIDREYLERTLVSLLEIPSPCGYTDNIVHFVGEELRRLEVPFELTRRGAIRADLKGEVATPDRAVVAHLDTLGAMVRALKPNGRCALVPIGTWSSRFAEGGRATLFTESGTYRGTVLPLKASGHVFDTEVDSQPVSWDNVELRVDARVLGARDLHDLGVRVGDYVSFDPGTEVTDTGFVNSRHLDDKAGVAAVLAAARAVQQANAPLPVDCHLLFTISEEVGSGASHVLHQDVAEMVAVDNSTPAPGQDSSELSVTIAMMDQSAPFDYHLTRKLIALCKENAIPFVRDIFRWYRSDAASAIEAGNDLRTALVGFGADASHGYERTHFDSLAAVASLLTLYMQSPPTAQRDERRLGSMEGFPTQPDA